MLYVIPITQGLYNSVWCVLNSKRYDAPTKQTCVIFEKVYDYVTDYLKRHGMETTARTKDAIIHEVAYTCGVKLSIEHTVWHR